MGRRAAEGMGEALSETIYSWTSLPLVGGSGRNHKETWAGCIVSLTTSSKSSLKGSRSVPSRSLAEKASRVLAALYFLR